MAHMVIVIFIASWFNTVCDIISQTLIIRNSGSEDR